MKFIQKIFYIFISLYFIFILFNFLYAKELYFTIFRKTLLLWFEKLVPSISIAYILSIFLFNYPLISTIFFPILKKIYLFENKKSCSLFLISIIIGNPTSTKLIHNAIMNNEISCDEGNRLLKFCNFISIPFLYTIFDNFVFIFIVVIELITATIISAFTSSKQNKSYLKDEKKQTSILLIYFDIINTLPNLLLSILTSMIICNIISIPIKNEYLISIFEITNGLSILTNLNYNLITTIFIFIIIFSHGLAIILQVYWIIKKTSLSFLNFIKYRSMAVIISLINLIIIYLLIFFF